MILVAVKAVPARSKPPVAVSVRVSMSEGHGFDAAAPLSTRVLSLKERAGGSTFMPKLVELVRPASTLFAEQLLQRHPCACESWCLVLRLPPWRDVAAEHHAHGQLNTDLCS